MAGTQLQSPATSRVFGGEHQAVRRMGRSHWLGGRALREGRDW